jgi:ribose 5-phosphate isomerase B
MKIVIASDHAGYEMKNDLVRWLKENSFEVEDLGNKEYDSKDDYPVFAAAVSTRISNKTADKGIILCGSGVGACIAANKFVGVRASVCHDIYSAKQGVDHDDMNVLCLGARIIGIALAKELVSGFVNTQFSNEERHLRRLEKVAEFEKH